jgi:hypothetical protein
MLVQVCTELEGIIEASTGEGEGGDGPEGDLRLAERLDRLTSSVILVSMGAFFYFLLSTSISSEPLSASLPPKPILDAVLTTSYS